MAVWLSAPAAPVLSGLGAPGGRPDWLTELTSDEKTAAAKTAAAWPLSQLVLPHAHPQSKGSAIDQAARGAALCVARTNAAAFARALRCCARSSSQRAERLS